MWIALLLAGCPGKTVDEGAHCEDTPTAVAADEVTVLGFAAADVLAFADGSHEAPFDWANHDPSTLTLDVVADASTARFVDSEAVYPDDGGTYTLMAPVCTDRVEVDATLAFATADGRFDESWAVVLAAEAATGMSFHHEIDLETVVGSWDILEDVTAEGYDSLRAWARGGFDAAGSTGVVDGQASGSEPCDDGDTCTAWAEAVAVGSWGVVEE